MNLSAYQLYYLQTNVICLCVLICIFCMYQNNCIKKAVDDIFFISLLVEVGMYCLADMTAALFKYTNFVGTREILYFANGLYIVIPAVIAFTWERYVSARLEGLGYHKTMIGNVLGFVVLFCAFLTVLSPVTEFAFYLDAENLYHRNFGGYLVPLACWLYFAYTTWHVVRIMHTVESIDEEYNVRALMYFAFVPFVTSVLQLLFYGITIIQVGFTLSILSVFLINQQNQISKDELTGLNNRREYEKFLHNMGRAESDMILCMVDVDRFKQINDSYGHAEGDKVLKRVAGILNNACKKAGENLFLARYGGDEFVLAGRNCGVEIADAIQALIQNEIRELNALGEYGCDISVSIGVSHGKVQSRKDVRELLHRADIKMYEAKKIRRA